MFLAVGGHPPTRPFRPFETLRNRAYLSNHISPPSRPSLTAPSTSGGFSIFHFSAVLAPNGSARPPQTLTFQYRTPRSRPVIPSPRSFSPPTRPASNIFLTQLSGNFPPSFFGLARAGTRAPKLVKLGKPCWVIIVLMIIKWYH